jgi:predicted nucleic acid-binding protein
VRLGIAVEANIPDVTPIPDEEDRKFYNVAKSSGAFLITGNIKHFPSESFIITPADFLRIQMGTTQSGR